VPKPTTPLTSLRSISNPACTNHAPAIQRRCTTKALLPLYNNPAQTSNTAWNISSANSQTTLKPLRLARFARRLRPQTRLLHNKS